MISNRILKWPACRYTIRAHNCRRDPMLRLITMRRAIRLALLTPIFIAFVSIRAADLDPKAINIQLPKDIKWVATAGGSEQAIMVGDPAKPGLYVGLTKWLPHKNSRPHSHPN